ncbi:amidohydrolase family protein [Aeromicrobium alkaliterrae]
MQIEDEASESGSLEGTQEMVSKPTLEDVSEKSKFDILDCHHHYGDLASLLGPGPSQALAVPTDSVEYRRVELETRLAAMDEQAIRQAVIIPGHSYLRPRGIADTRSVNDGVAEYRDRIPARFPAAVGIVEPLHGRAGYDELDRISSELGLVGISVHVRFQGLSLDSPWVRDYIKRAVDLGLVPFVHVIADSSENALWKFEIIAADNPEAKIIALDAFTSHEQARHVLRIAERFPNVLFDTSLAYHWSEVELLVQQFGSERAVFGTDLYSMMPHGAHVLSQILDSSISDSDKANILGGNIRRALKLIPSNDSWSEPDD